VEAHQELEGEGNTAEEEIGAARRSSGGLLGAAALRERGRAEKRRVVKRGLCPPFYSPEREGRRARRRWSGEVGGRPPLMARLSAAAVLVWWRRVGEVEGAGEAVRRRGSARPVERRGETGEAAGGAVWPAAGAGKVGGWRWETAPTGGPHLSVAA
jgi:hypothetical protein